MIPSPPPPIGIFTLPIIICEIITQSRFLSYLSKYRINCMYTCLYCKYIKSCLDVVGSLVEQILMFVAAELQNSVWNVMLM